MVGKAVASLFGFIGGLLVALSGLISFLEAIGGEVAYSHSSGVAGGLIWGLLAGLLGLFIILLSRPRLFWWRGRLMMNGAMLIVLGVVTWVVIPGGLLVAIGAVLAVLSGFIYAVESLVPGRTGLRSLF